MLIRPKAPPFKAKGAPASSQTGVDSTMPEAVTEARSAL